MHREHADVVVLVIAFGGAAVGTAIGTLIALRLRRRIFAGPALDQWRAGCRELSRGEQLRVQWATLRRRPVSAARLASAQLAYVCYARYTVERSPLTRNRWFRAAFPVFYGLFAIIYAVEGMQQSQARIFHFGLAAAFAALAVTWAIAVPRSFNRMPARLERLQAQISNRYGPADGPTGAPAS
jgi:hypothetical protein